MTKQTPKPKQEEEYDPYCPHCGGCGFIGCCGIAEFLKQHVVGKTNCLNESGFVYEILEIVNDTLNETMRLTPNQIEKISGVKVVKSSTKPKQGSV